MDTCIWCTHLGSANVVMEIMTKQHGWRIANSHAGDEAQQPTTLWYTNITMENHHVQWVNPL